MKHLLEIAQIIHRVKGRKSDVFEDGVGGLSSKNSKFNEFYEALLAGRYKNDRDAATHLYGCSPTDDRYRQLKSRFRKRLLNTLFAIDQYQTAATSAYERAVFQCNKDWALVRILATHDAPHTAADIARGVLNTALKFHLTEFVLNPARTLREYTLHHGTEQDFEVYDALVREYSQIFEAEVRSESICHRVMLHHQLQTTPAKKEAFRDEIVQASNDLERLYEKFKSPDLYVNCVVIRACRCETERDWNGILAICREFDQFVLQHPHFQHHKKIEKLWLKKFGAYLHLRDFSRGRLDAERLLQSVPEGDSFWFMTLDRYFLLAMHTGQFAEAKAIYERAANHSKFRKLPAAEREKWQIYDTYLNLFVYRDGNEGGTVKLPGKNGKSLSESIVTAKDNRLLAVHHSVVQVVNAIAQDNYIGAAGQIDQLKSLANRQFKTDQPGRTLQFIRLLQHLAKSGFTNLNHNGTAQAFAELRRIPFHYSGVVQDLEVVPYERIWEEIVHNLQGN
ncbi:MAG: hypothetical protein U0U46_03395 [Saprospiraceae bacterium]|nr:hypothetical protein [Saprospiraceae bacterium]